MTNHSAASASPKVLLPTGAAAGRLLVCERRGRWAGVLRRELGEACVRVWETRSVSECWEALADTPASFVVIEFSEAQAEGLLRRMARLEREFPLARVAIVAERRWAACQWLMREAGAVHFITSLRQVGPLAELACRHLANVPAPPQSASDRIWATLPWGEAEGAD